MAAGVRVWRGAPLGRCVWPALNPSGTCSGAGRGAHGCEAVFKNVSSNTNRRHGTCVLTVQRAVESDRHAGGEREAARLGGWARSRWGDPLWVPRGTSLN